MANEYNLFIWRNLLKYHKLFDEISSDGTENENPKTNYILEKSKNVASATAHCVDIIE